MRVLTVRQPFAWCILRGGKNIENRSRRTHYRGELLIQASASKPDPAVLDFIREHYRIRLPSELPLGGIVGVVDLTDVVTRENHKAQRSPWFEGPFGWVLENPREIPFIPMKGQLGIFQAPAHVIETLKKFHQKLK